MSRVRQPRPAKQAAWRRYLRFWGHDPARDLDDELRFHVQARYDEYLAAGMDPAAARAEVERRFGDVTRVRAECADIDSQWSRTRTIAELLHTVAADLRYAARQLRHTPSVTVAAILCFALGIGANTSVFSVVDAVLFRPLPFADPGRLVIIGEDLLEFGGGKDNATISPPEFDDYKMLDGRVFRGIGIFENHSLVLSGAGAPERVVGTQISASLLGVLGVRPALGRGFAHGEDDPSATDVAILSDALWRRRFGGNPSVVGSHVTIDGRQFAIVGVMPRTFAFPLPGLENGVGEIFVPFKITPLMRDMRGNSYSTVLVARLAPGKTIEQAQAGAADVARRLPQMYPGLYGAHHTTIATVYPMRERAVGDVRSSLLVLLAAVGLVLLIACINVSSLLMARAAARQRELSVRRALGASRGRLLQQFLTEAFLLAALGGVLGVAFSLWGARLIASHAPNALLAGYDVAIDVRVLLFTAAIIIGTTIAISVVPALQQHEGALASRLRDEGRSASSGAARQRGRRTLVVTEIALALVVAVGAALMVKSFLEARGSDPGFNPEHLVSFKLTLPGYRYRSDADLHRAQIDLLDRLRALPGARSATGATLLPMTGTWHIAASLEGVRLDKTPIVLNKLVFPGYFETLQIPMRAGSAFTGRESDESPGVAVINESFAKRYFGTTNPIGRRVKWGSPTSAAPWETIIGVSADVHETSLDTPPEPEMFMPAFQHDTGLVSTMIRGMTYVVRTQDAPERMFGAIRKIVRDVDPELPVVDLRTQDDVVSLSVASRRFNTALLSSFALLALVLAAIGIYGLMAFTIVQRNREIGIRLAIGATRRNVLALVVGQGMRLGALGIAIGLIGAVTFARAMRTLLFDVSPLDPAALLGAAGLLFLVVALASYFPARRAARIDPQIAMRS